MEGTYVTGTSSAVMGDGQVTAKVKTTVTAAAGTAMWLRLFKELSTFLKR